MKYLVSLTAAATILLTQSCLEQRVDEYQVPPQLNTDAKGMVLTSKQPDVEPVVSPQTEKDLKLLLYSITPVHDNYY